MEQLALLEYDGTQEAVINPAHEALDVAFPKIAVFAFVGDCIEEYAKEQQLEKIAEFETITKIYPLYRVHYKGKELCLCQAPLGAPAAVQFMDWLIGYGVQYVISTGSCGVLENLPENTFLIPVKALRDEGTSFHYLPPSRYIELNKEMQEITKKCFQAKGIHYQECVTWTTDGFFRETKEKVLARKREGCAAVEMECSALAACAEFRGVKFGQFLFTADSLSSVEEYDERDWGHDSLRPALMLCLEIAAGIEGL